ncbi:MFS transporter [Mycolicibacterium gilvum]|uniref:Putative proline/betaine transporter n=2 Tax=Mycolicibacterium gilvum TaxID=1804 RepID=E6TMF8_MYCSR|nr:MFS transporter [Mycolicibacterium gilvum]ADU00514.1 arabinose efflux permease family protein [Mycolicibacterium gilvum Spyr1]MCV7057228.1 MHS family MFS transporter [Mycolicibacterium gilvum]STZ42439.1 major facilitator transporter [Mycolicibacterium gilvum]
MTIATPSDPATLRRVALSSLLGTAIEYYDFLVYGTMSALVFGRVFFPDSDPAVATIAAFGTLAAGYVARPVGGILFGHFGDRLGRKRMLVLTMGLMGAASFAIGLLPTFAAVGVTAPLLLVALRVIQGIAIGGEWGGATLMVTEHAEPHRRGFWNGVMQMGSPIGSLLSVTVVTAITLLPDEAFVSWGWRVPFLLSVVLLAIGVYVRVSITESPVFEQAKPKVVESRRIPLIEVLRRPRNLILACAVGIGPFALTALISTHMISYATSIGYHRTDVMTSLVFTSLSALIAIPVFSALSDRVGRRPVMLVGGVAIICYAWPFYWLVDMRAMAWLVVAMMVAQIVQSLMYAPLGALYSEMFGTTVRYTGASMGYQLAALVGAGFTPMIASSLLVDEVTSVPLVVLAMGCGAVTVLAVWRIRETQGVDLAGIDSGRNAVRTP